MNPEQQQEANSQAVKDAKRVRAFQDMVSSDGWKFFQELLNLRIVEATSKLFERPIPGVDDRRGEEWDKGAVFAWIMSRDLPSVTIAAHKQMNSEPATED